MNTNKSIALQNTQIIEKRKEAKKTYAPMEQQVYLWLETAQKVSKFPLESNQRAVWNALLQKNNLLTLWNSISKSTDDFITLVTPMLASNGSIACASARSQREWLNIGCVGVFREGKSEFIQKVTGLDEWIIPCKNLAHPCTGTSINIINGSTIDKKINAARIFFYSVTEVSKILNEYFVKLGLSQFHAEAKTKAELREFFETHSDNIIYAPINDNKNNAIKGKLDEYVYHWRQYIDKLLDPEDTVLYNDIEEITKSQESKKKYYPCVSYYKTPSESTLIYEVLATKKAEVYVSYKICDQDDISNCQFLDTAGIGEAKLNVDQSLKDAISRELDIAIAIRSVKPGRAWNHDDVKFNKIVREELNGRTFSSDWLYYVLNYYANTDLSDIDTILYKARKSLKQEVKGNTSILLPIDHFAVIDCKNNKRLSIKEQSTTQVPMYSQEEFHCKYVAENDKSAIQSFLYDVMQKVVGAIENIDKDYNTLAEKDYEKAEKAYNTLLDKVLFLKQRLSNIFNPTSVSLNEVLKIHKELSTPAPDITEQISADIQKFANPKYVGVQLLKIFKDDSVDSESESDILKSKLDEFYNSLTKKYIDSFKQNHYSGLLRNNDYDEVDRADNPYSWIEDIVFDQSDDNEAKQYSFDLSILIGESVKRSLTPFLYKESNFDESQISYDTYEEFHGYANLKDTFRKRILKELRELIKDDTAKSTIDKIKKTTWEILRRPGRFGFVAEQNDSNDTWFKKLIAKFEQDKFLKIRDLFVKFYDFDLNIDEYADAYLKTTLEYFHFDDFGPFSFRKAELAYLSIIHSFISIEKSLLEALIDSTSKFNDIKENCNRKFKNERQNFVRIFTQGIDPVKPVFDETYLQVVEFLIIHFSELYGNSNEGLEITLKNQWDEILNLNNHG